MTLFHFANCIALAVAPYFITYKYSGLAEYSSIWKIAQAGLGYFVAQLCKMLVLATVFPASEFEGEHFSGVNEFLKSTVDLLDLVGLYLVITRAVGGKGEVRFLAGGLGWATADLLATRLLPFWMGARGLEFDWMYVRLSLESNLNLVHFLAVAFLVWFWSRQQELSSALYPFVVGMLVYSAYRHLLLELMTHVLHVSPWWLLACNALFTLAFGLLAMNMYLTVRRRENSH